MKEPTDGYPAPEHALILEGRKRAVIRGVQGVDSFNEQLVTLITVEGALTLMGEGLHVSRLDLEDGQLLVEGEIAALQYEGPHRAKGSLLSRLFR